MDNDTSAREEKLLAAKKKLKKYQKKKANNASSVDKSSTESATVSNTRRSSMSSDAGSVKTDYTDGKVLEIITNSEENIAQNDVTPNITGVEINQNQNVGDHHNQAEFTQQRLSPSTNNSSSHGSTVEELQPVDYHQPSGKESQTDLLTTPTDGIASTENLSIATAENFSDDQTITFEGLANICRMQQQTITLLMEEKTALASELEKFSAMANRFKSSEELLKEGQLLVDALRRQNAELEEKVRTVEDQLKETNSQNENIIEKLQLQNARIQQLENDNKQQLSQLNVKDSIIEQLKAEKNNNFSASNQVETLQKILKDKEERIKELETESTNLKLRFTNLEQQLSEKQEKILALERDSGEKQQTDGSLYHSKDDDKQKEPLSSPTTTDRRISLSQFSSDFEIGRCSGCIGEIVII